MTVTRHAVFAACAVAFALAGCGKQDSGTGDKPAAAAPKKVAEEKVPPYIYPAPVKGHYKEINIGEFDLVDGIAYSASGGGGTVVYVTDKPIASPMLTDSACPMTQARVLTKLRNGRYAEVTLDSAGRSKYFAAGTAFGGSSREQDVGSHPWSSKLKLDAGRAVGIVVHKHDGHFEFDLPVSSPRGNEQSESDWGQSRRADPTLPKPTEQAVTAAYLAVHDAAIKKDLRALLLALGFAKAQATAIRGLDGIDADLAVYSDRFLTTGTPGEFTAKAGTAYLRVAGTNAKGKKFANYYHFVPCGEHLVLAAIAENPQ
jgi:hypothetical protein